MTPILLSPLCSWDRTSLSENYEGFVLCVLWSIPPVHKFSDCRPNFSWDRTSCHLIQKPAGTGCLEPFCLPLLFWWIYNNSYLQICQHIFRKFFTYFKVFLIFRYFRTIHWTYRRPHTLFHYTIMLYSAGISAHNREYFLFFGIIWSIGRSLP